MDAVGLESGQDLWREAVPFLDLGRQYDSIKETMTSAINNVLRKGYFVMGEQLEEFEHEFASYIGVRYAIGVASGTDAIYLSLAALEIGPGDEVITVPNTAVPTVCAICMTGARPVLVDVDPLTLTMDVECVNRSITDRTKAIIPVHLYGNVADMESLLETANRHKLAVIEDACQAHGSQYRGRKAGSIGTLGAFSFYPTKNLGCYGDGGMVVTNHRLIADKIRLLRNYGMVDRKEYVHILKGVNSRLDEVQAAVLRVKLIHLDEWNNLRRDKALLYNNLLSTAGVSTPYEPSYARHNYHLYVVRSKYRRALLQHLRTNNISCLVHYPIPIHLQPAYLDLGYSEGSFPVAEECAGEILSLPMFPELTSLEVRAVGDAIHSFQIMG